MQPALTGPESGVPELWLVTISFQKYDPNKTEVSFVYLSVLSG
jgi:hypothetical protein